MNLRAYLFLSVAAFLLLYAGCQQNPTEPTATKASYISGIVHDAENNPLALARVFDLGSLAQVDTSKADGSYTLTLQLSDNYNTSVYAKVAGYKSDTQKVSLTPGGSITGINIRMTVVDSGSIVAGTSGPPASIVLKSPVPGSIALKGTGINETAVLTFIVKDSVGNPVVGSQRCVVNFRLSARPDTLTSINPTSALTNKLTGEVSTNISAGITPGVLQVIASTRGDSVKASPVFLSAGGGLPDSGGVSMGANPINIAGRVYGNLESKITMFVNDRWGNPVANGTKVSFVTTAGSIVSSTTSQEGLATVTLKSTLNFPTNPLVTLTATTNGDKYYRPADSSIVRQMRILFSGPTAPVALDTSTTNRFDIPDGGTKFFKFRVSDDKGYPLVPGSTISISVDGADTLTKNLAILGSSFTFPDVQSPSWTYFTVGIVDKLIGGGSGSITIGIHVSSTNGSADCWFGGRILPSGAVTGTTFNGPASIATVDTSTKKMYFLETQKPDTVTKLTFIVKDAYGQPLQSSNKAGVKFFLSGAPAGVHFYPHMTTLPVSDSTDSKGTVSVMVTSGNTPGTFTVQARTTNGANSYDVFSVPIVIRHGLPDSNFISYEMKKNMFNAKSKAKVGIFTLNLEDYTSDIPAPTNVQFSTTGGSIGAMAISDSNSGKVVVNLYGGNEPNDPTLGPGWGYIKPTLLVHGGVTVTEYFPFLFTYAPQIAITSTSVMNATLDTLETPLGDGETLYNFGFAVWDKNLNPISSANSITVTALPSSILLGGDVNLTNLKDTQDPADAVYHISISNKSGGSVGTFAVTITVSGESGVASKTIIGKMAAKTPVTSGYASSIQLLSGSPSSKVISVQGTGATETATMSFVVKDSTGNPLSSTHQANVTFSIVGGPNGGEFVSPNSGWTDASGVVTTAVNAGTKAGVMQVVAKTIVNSDSIKSAPVSLTIASGLADPGHFSLWTDLYNWPGEIKNGVKIGTAYVQVGDKYGNAVQPNTALYFTSTAGIIGSSAYTDETGHAFVDVFGGNPIPANGIDTITVSTLGQDGITVQQKVNVTYSGATIIRVPSYSSGDIGTINANSSLVIDYTVADAKGNPPAGGNTIIVTPTGSAGGFVGLTGDIAFVTQDTRDRNSTNHQFAIVNNVLPNQTGGSFSITISSTGENGLATLILHGSLQTPGTIGGSTTDSIASIVCTSAPADISVQGTGKTETANLVFIGKDKSGKPVDLAHGSIVTFTISPPTLGAALTITSAKTDGTGQAVTLVRSGTISGVIQVTASAVVNGVLIKSQPVNVSINSGLPDQKHFSMSANRYNFASLNWDNLYDAINVQMGDKYSNPVSINTEVYFSTSHGQIVTKGSTSSLNGFITKDLISSDPRPDGTPGQGPQLAYTFNHPGGLGWTRVYAQTYNDAGGVVQDSLDILWTGIPILSNIGLAGGQSIAHNGSLAGFAFTLMDQYGHPMPSGTSITITCPGAKVTSNAPTASFPDVTSGYTSFSITLQDGDGGTSPATPPTSDLIVTVNHPVFGQTSIVLAIVTIN